jgi:hypothetical protein
MSIGCNSENQLDNSPEKVSLKTRTGSQKEKKEYRIYYGRLLPF